MEQRPTGLTAGDAYVVRPNVKTSPCAPDVELLKVSLRAECETRVRARYSVFACAVVAHRFSGAFARLKPCATDVENVLGRRDGEPCGGGGEEGHRPLNRRPADEERPHPGADRGRQDTFEILKRRSAQLAIVRTD